MVTTAGVQYSMLVVVVVSSSTRTLKKCSTASALRWSSATVVGGVSICLSCSADHMRNTENYGTHGTHGHRARKDNGSLEGTAGQPDRLWTRILLGISITHASYMFAIF